MRILRWIACIPVAAFVAIVIGTTWAKIFPTAYYSGSNVVASITGLAPSFMGRWLPVAVAVLLAASIAPSRGLILIGILGLLGGIFGSPFGPQYQVNSAANTFYLVEITGSIAGAATGMLVAYLLWSKNPKCANASNARPESAKE